MELEITSNHVLRIWWSYIWRNVLMVILSTVLGFIIGFSISFAGEMFGTDEGIVNSLIKSLSIGVGVLLSILPVKWILGKDFGAFRLVMLVKEPSGPTTPAS